MRAWFIAIAVMVLPALAVDAAAQAPPAGDADIPDDLPIVVYPRLLEYVEADYPAEARAQGLEATVGLLIELDEGGAVTHVEVIEPAGHGFDEAAMAATQRMRFTPARTEVGPVGVALPFDYAFKLDVPPPAGPAPADDKGGRSEPGAADPADLPILESPSILTYVEAPYPPEAEAAGVEGTVVLLVTLDEEGVVEDVAVSTPAGYGFDEAALDAVRQMTFNPARTEAGPVGVVFEFAYTFALTPEAPEQDAPAPVNVEGTVRRMGPRTPVVGANVVIDGLDMAATTDVDGRFELRGVPDGPHVLRVRHPAYVELEQPIEVVAGEVTSASLFLRALTYRDNEAVGFYERERQEVTRRTLSIQEIKRIPGTFGDPVKVVQTLPGAARSPFGTGLLIIRGANPEDTAVYVDGVRLPIIYHLTGTTSVLSPEIVASVDYLPGGYGVQYGRSMAGTVDVKTKDRFGDPKIVFGFDVLDAQVWFEGNLGKKKQHGVALGARRSYIDAFIPLFTGDTGFTIRPIYWDYQFKYVPDLGADDYLSVFVFGFQDTLAISTPDDVAQGADQDTQGNISTAYQSHRFMLTYRHTFSDKLRFSMTPTVGLNINSFGLGDAFGLDNQNIITQLRAELSYTPHPAIEIVPGLDFIGGPFTFDFKSPFSFADLDDPLAERDPVGFDGFGSAWSPTPFLKLNIRPLADRGRWLIAPGIRYDNTTYFVYGGITQEQEVEPSTFADWDPRLSTRFVAWEKDDASVTIKGATGLYGQPPQPFQSIGLGTTARLLPERSWNSSVGIEHRINQAITWELEGFYRQMDRLIQFNDAGFTGQASQPFVNQGEGFAAGFELIVRHNPVNRFFGWISYTFSRSFRRSNPDADWVPFNFDQPHIFSAQGGYNFPKDFGLSAQIQVVSGNPFTPLNAGIYDADTDQYNGFRVGASNSERLPTFVQTSVRVDKTFTFRVWQMEIYLELINALRGVNPEQTVYSYDFDQFAFVRGLPLIPNLGFEFRIFP